MRTYCLFLQSILHNKGAREVNMVNRRLQAALSRRRLGYYFGRQNDARGQGSMDNSQSKGTDKGRNKHGVQDGCRKTSITTGMLS